jgi:hypothetical protein
MESRSSSRASAKRSRSRPTPCGPWIAASDFGLLAMTKARQASGRRDDGCTAAANEADVENLARNRRTKPSGKMQRRTVAYRRLHGIGKRGIVAPAAARLYEHNPRPANDSAFPREAGANRNLIVIMRRTPAGGDPCRDAVNAGDQRALRLSGLRRRLNRQCENSVQGNRSPSGQRQPRSLSADRG